MRVLRTTAIAGAAICCALVQTIVELPARTVAGVTPMAVNWKLPVPPPPPADPEPQEPPGTIRVVTAYNVGDPDQNAGDPCIAASGENICRALENGLRRCAANFVPIGTRLAIDQWGVCTVTDRMNRRYRNRVDVAMKPDEQERAKAFGKKRLRVRILAPESEVADRSSGRSDRSRG